MEEYATILIEKNSLSSLQESINIGKTVLERKLSVYKKKATKFEHANGMDTQTFTMSFNRGDLGGRKEWVEWEHVAAVITLLKKKLDDLKNLKYEC